MSLKFWLAAAVALGTVAGCATPVAEPDRPALPQQFSAAPASPTTTWPDASWYQGFASEELNALLDSAEHHNYDLAAARARVLQAAARARAAGSALLPEIGVNANAASYAGHSSAGSAHETDWAALLTASYEVDFWGKNRAASRAASDLGAASAADRDTLDLTTRAAIADAYFQLLSVREREALAESDTHVTAEVLEVVEARYNAGLTGAVELAQQRTAAANAQVLLPQLKQQEMELLGTLAVLAGQNPEGFTLSGRSLDALAEPAIAPGLPTELLTRRPDLRSAEANLRAANADVAVARAALLPSLTLTGSGGVQDPAVQAAVLTLAGTGASLTLGANLVQTVFDNGRRRALRQEAEAHAEELLASYRGAILSALQDVEAALSARTQLEQERVLLAEGLKQSRAALEGARARYQAGAGDFLTVLDAQRAAFSAEEQVSQNRLERLQVLIALCKALGGGWDVAPTGATVNGSASTPPHP